MQIFYNNVSQTTYISEKANPSKVARIPLFEKTNEILIDRSSQ